MKKRMLSLALALIMMLSLVPMSAFAATASSESAVTLLKQLQKYTTTCIKIGEEYRTGYGTVCETCTKNYALTSHVRNETMADQALRAKLKELDSAVNAFASKAGVGLTQAQHDALVLISYDIGTSWMNGTGVLRNAVAAGMTGNDIINAIGHSTAYGIGETDYLQKVEGFERRMIEANLYVNGVYSNVAPSNYRYVTYNPDGGAMTEAYAISGTYIQYFDANLLAAPAPAPTKTGYIFLGWYENGETWIPRLDSYRHGVMLTAKWQPWNATYTGAAEVYNWLNISSLASTTIYNNPTSKTVIGTQTNHDVILDRDFIDGDGTRWGRLQGNKGWVIVSGAVADTNSSSIQVMVTVTNEKLNRRVNASIYSRINGSYKKGDSFCVTNPTESNGYLWGQVIDAEGEAIGWVALMYTDWYDVKDGNDTGSQNNGAVIGTAVVDTNGYLNIRSGAGTDHPIVGALAHGDHVDLYDIQFVNGHQWGRISNGWILLTYTKVTMTTNLNYQTDKNAVAYSFQGEMLKDVLAQVEADPASAQVGSWLKKDSVVTVSMLKNGSDGKLWGFNGTGWIQLENVILYHARFEMIADSVNVRVSPSSDSEIKDKLVKGVEIQVRDLAVVGATLWGYSAKYDGWVNLAATNVKRNDPPAVTVTTGPSVTGLLATIVGADNVNVRTTSSIYAAKIGTLSRGTTVRVWDGSDEEGWYKVDSNQNGVYDEVGDGWVSLKHLSLEYGEVGGTDSTGSTATVVETGLGVVANTYTGVNVRQGPSTAYAAVGKVLTGTTVEILEVTTGGASKWGRIAQGWICMDYVTMLQNYLPDGVGGTTESTTTSGTGSNPGGSTSNTIDNTTITSTPAVYTGYIVNGAVNVMQTYDADALTVAQMNVGDMATLHELVKVVNKVITGTTIDGNAETITYTYETTYWGRVNGGWIQDPARYIALNPLDEQVYTVTGADRIYLRSSANNADPSNIVLSSGMYVMLDKGTQVKITKVQITEDKVWGYAENINNLSGWVRLDNLSEGAVSTSTNTNDNNTVNNNTGSNVTLGNGSDVGGYVTNDQGYRYTGTIIRTNTVNIRATASTSAAITTQIKNGGAVVIYETVTADNMAWGRCDAGWVYLYYVDLVPVTGAVDARVVYNENTVIYSDMNCTTPVGTYARMSVIDIYEIVGKMARTDIGWVNTDNLL